MDANLPRVFQLVSDRAKNKMLSCNPVSGFIYLMVAHIFVMLWIYISKNWNFALKSLKGR